MSWVSLDDQFHRNPKVTNVGLAGAGLYARALSYCGDCLTDGYVPYGWAREVGTPSLCKKLAVVELWIVVAGGEVFTYEIDGSPYKVAIQTRGYFIPDYLTFNPTRIFVEAKRDEIRQKRSEAGKKGAAARWGDGKQDGNRNGKADGKPMANVMATAMANSDFAMANAWQTDGPTPLPLEEQEPSVLPTALQDVEDGRPEPEQPPDHTPDELERLAAAVLEDMPA